MDIADAQTPAGASHESGSACGSPMHRSLSFKAPPTPVFQTGAMMRKDAVTQTANRHNIPCMREWALMRWRVRDACAYP